MKNPTSKKAVVAALKGAQLKAHRRKLGARWRLSEGRRLKRDFEFKDFRAALAFTNKVGALAEKLQHHPDVALSWGKVGLTIWTHSIGGLSEADFTLAGGIGKLSK
jgi:4a-hydroxytetrahydrobiopterin dehydratase